MGSTLAFRRADLERIGGFEAIADYLADDYQLGARLHALGLKCVLSEVIVGDASGRGLGRGLDAIRCAGLAPFGFRNSAAIWGCL